MKSFIALAILISSFTAIAAPEPILVKLDRLNIKTYLCVISGTFKVDSKDSKFKSGLVNVFASDETEAIKSCLTTIKAVKLGYRESQDVQFVANLPGMGDVTITSIEIQDIND